MARATYVCTPVQLLLISWLLCILLLRFRCVYSLILQYRLQLLLLVVHFWLDIVNVVTHLTAFMHLLVTLSLLHSLILALASRSI